MLSEAKDLGTLFCASKMHRSFAAKASLRMTTFNMSAKKSVLIPVKEVKRSCPRLPSNPASKSQPSPAHLHQGNALTRHGKIQADRPVFAIYPLRRFQHLQL